MRWPWSRPPEKPWVEPDRTPVVAQDGLTIALYEGDRLRHYLGACRMYPFTVSRDGESLTLVIPKEAIYYGRKIRDDEIRRYIESWREHFDVMKLRKLEA